MFFVWYRRISSQESNRNRNPLTNLPKSSTFKSSKKLTAQYNVSERGYLMYKHHQESIQNMVDYFKKEGAMPQPRPSMDSAPTRTGISM